MRRSQAGLAIERLRDRTRPKEQLDALFVDGWPAFIEADEEAARWLPTVRERFADLEIVLLRDDVLVAAAWGVPIRWSGQIDDLPSGYGDALRRAVLLPERSEPPDTLVICAAQIRPGTSRGGGLAAILLTGLIETAGLRRVVAPLRPTLKHRYPLTPIEQYVEWTRPDGTAFDPWLRTHLGMGGRVLRTSDCSQVFTGTVAQWQEWSGLELPGDGTYLVPGALSPLHVDLARDLGTCAEPAIWVRHR